MQLSHRKPLSAGGHKVKDALTDEKSKEKEIMGGANVPIDRTTATDNVISSSSIDSSSSLSASARSPRRILRRGTGLGGGMLLRARAQSGHQHQHQHHLQRQHQQQQQHHKQQQASAGLSDATCDIGGVSRETRSGRADKSIILPTLSSSAASSPTAMTSSSPFSSNHPLLEGHDSSKSVQGRQEVDVVNVTTATNGDVDVDGYTGGGGGDDDYVDD